MEFQVSGPRKVPTSATASVRGCVPGDEDDGGDDAGERGA